MLVGRPSFTRRALSFFSTTSKSLPCNHRFLFLVFSGAYKTPFPQVLCFVIYTKPRVVLVCPIKNSLGLSGCLSWLFLFINLRVASPATPVFSQSSALPGVAPTHSWWSSLAPPSMHQVSSFQTLAHSLSPFFESDPLFSMLYALFWKIPRGGVAFRLSDLWTFGPSDLQTTARKGRECVSATAGFVTHPTQQTRVPPKQVLEQV